MIEISDSDSRKSTLRNDEISGFKEAELMFIKPPLPFRDEGKFFLLIFIFIQQKKKKKKKEFHELWSQNARIIGQRIEEKSSNLRNDAHFEDSPGTFFFHFSLFF